MCITKEEFDSNPIAWKIYNLMYAENFVEAFEIIDKPRKHIKNSFSYKGKHTSQMNFSGETDFNFGHGWAHTKYEKYVKLITQTSISQEDETKYSNHLNICSKLYKSIVNISIMPQTGNLQSAKKGIGNDRMDVFIWALAEYYNKSSNVLTNYCSYENMESLQKYLDIFGDVYNYCDAIYHINESLVNDLIKSGKESIDSVERMVSYMDLASKFWRQKIVFLKKKRNQSKEISQAITTADDLLEKFSA